MCYRIMWRMHFIHVEACSDYQEIEMHMLLLILCVSLFILRDVLNMQIFFKFKYPNNNYSMSVACIHPFQMVY